jgi:glyoxylase-like metal-dependent hydrolase (beta-lactamase superfamily II)
VVVDAGISTSLTGRYKRIVENKFGQKNFIYVINSHGHHDHIRGNSIFESAQIVGNTNCRDDAPDPDTNKDTLLGRTDRIVNDYDRQLQQSDPNTGEWEDNFTQKIRYSGSYLDISRNVPLKLPDVTFPDSMTLKCGDTTFEMIYFGRFHSDSDILIYVPEIKTLFVGDLFSKYGRPG